MAQRPDCDTSGTTVSFLSETCDGGTCTWNYKVYQTGFALSHWVLDLCPCLYERIVAVGYIDAEDNETTMLECTGGSTPCWEFGLDPTTGLAGLKWDNLPGPENEYWTFYVTLNQDVGVDEDLQWTSKFAACTPGSGNVEGPECSCGCGHLIAFKYYDVNEDGVYNESDYELANWNICLDGDCSYVTDEMGFVDFGCLDPGDYEICEVQEEGWVRTEPDIEPCHSVTLNAGEQVQVRVHFGNHEEQHQFAYIRGAKYYDSNQNGEYDNGDYPLNDWEICLNDDCKRTRDICMLCGGCTDYWQVPESGIPYTLCETGVGDFFNTDPGVHPPCRQATCECGDFLCAKFGNYESITVGGVGEPANPPEPFAASEQSAGDSSNHMSVALWAGLAAVIAVGGGILLIKRRRAHQA